MVDSRVAREAAGAASLAGRAGARCEEGGAGVGVGAGRGMPKGGLLSGGYAKGLGVAGLRGSGGAGNVGGRADRRSRSLMSTN